MFVNDALAQTAAAAAPQASVASTLIQLALIFIVFYFILIRPQQKKISQHQAMLEAIKKGDKIITGGGIYGTVTKADGIKLEVKIAEGLTVTAPPSATSSTTKGKPPLPPRRPRNSPKP